MITSMTPPSGVTYGSTKTSNLVFCKLMSHYTGKSTNLKPLVDFQYVRPGPVTTALANYDDGPLASKPEDTSFGSLSNLGDLKESGGSTIHGIVNVIMPMLNFEFIQKGM